MNDKSAFSCRLTGFNGGKLEIRQIFAQFTVASSLLMLSIRLRSVKL